MSEKRYFGRVSFGTDARLDIDGQRMTGALLDISLKGALLEFETPPQIKAKTACHLSIHLPNSDVVLDFNAEAVHFHDRCIGVKFTESDPDSFSHLRRLLELNTGDPEQVEKELHLLFQHP